MVMCLRHGVYFLLQFIFICTVLNSAKLLHGRGNPGGLKLQLIHGLNRAQSVSQLGRFKQLVHRDTFRLRAISQRARQKQGNVSDRRIEEISYDPACNSGNTRRAKNRSVSGEFPMRSGADYGNGEYFVNIRVGSPAQKLMLVADTGSDLTWMNCIYRCLGGGCRRKSNTRRVFRADYSSSFRTLPCSSRTCKVDLANLFSLARCPSPMNPCAYDYRYSDGSSTLGLFANEKVTFPLTSGRKIRLHNVLVGCSASSRGQSFQGADGVIGLGYSRYSFARQAADRFGGKFSYCLVDHLAPRNVSSYLIFGSHKQVNLSFSKMHYTELALGSFPSFYAVSIRGISIGRSMLKIPAETWNVSGKGGVILDSGASLTALARPAYGPIMAKLRRLLAGFQSVDLGIGPIEYCFNATGFKESRVPRLAFHFRGGSRFEPPVKSYVIDAAPGVKCLGFVAAAWPGVSVIGNIMQQNHFWEFDLTNGRLGFATSLCT